MLSNNDKLFISETVGKAIEENNKVLLKKFDSIEKSLKALSVNDKAVVKDKATSSGTTSKSSNTAKKPSTSKSSAKKSGIPLKSTVKANDRIWIDGTRRLDSNEWKKVKALVDKYEGKIRNVKEKTKLPHWTFTDKNGRAFANAVAKLDIWA